jgi:hypothetical protein
LLSAVEVTIVVPDEVGVRVKVVKGKVEKVVGNVTVVVMIGEVVVAGFEVVVVIVVVPVDIGEVVIILVVDDVAILVVIEVVVIVVRGNVSSQIIVAVPQTVPLEAVIRLIPVTADSTDIVDLASASPVVELLVVPVPVNVPIPEDICQKIFAYGTGFPYWS